MKFAIYGDSFAESSFHLHPKPELNKLAWTTLLAQQLGATSVDYYALGGSSFFYSYQKMLESADSYDRCIIAVSEPQRYTKEIAGHRFTGPPLHPSYPGISSLTIRNITGWFASLDEDFMNTAQELMIRDIELRWPQTVIVPSFRTSFTGARALAWNNFYLSAITEIAVRQLRLENNHARMERNTATGILCHMPVEWHSTVARTIYNFIQTGTIAVPRLRVYRTAEHYYTSI